MENPWKIVVPAPRGQSAEKFGDMLEERRSVVALERR
jgi:hypothetical protein